jgi:hypothetical protein
MVAVGAAALLLAAGCSSGGGSPSGSPSGPGAATPSGTASAPGSPAPSAGTTGASGAASPASGTYSKVMIIVEENKEDSQVIGGHHAPYLKTLSQQFGQATQMDAGYPTTCPSLAAYILVTSGDTHGICDDDAPSAHQLTADNVFRQVAATGQQWRMYAESMPANCFPTNSDDGHYLVRHAPAPYYVTERARCRQWDVPMGTTTSGALHDDVAAGRLPALSFVTPNACDDMHGAQDCSDNLVAAGDAWLSRWMRQIMAGPDYRAGRLVVVVTWDEGSHKSNHIPTLVISPTTQHLRSGTAWNHCSTLRTTEELLHLPLLACAASARSMTSAFRL